MNRYYREKAAMRDHITNNCRSLPNYLRRVLTVKSIVTALVAFTAIYFVTSYIHTETYIWQCTTLAGSVRPVERKWCPAVSRSEPAIPSGQLKIGLLMVYDDNYGGSDKRLVPRLIENRQRYCAKYGCTVISSPVKKSSRPPAWEKLTAMIEQLQTGKYDYIWYIDMDMIIMNPAKSPESFLSQAPRGQDFVLTSDWSGVNTGIMFARNSDFSKWFLQTAYDQSQLVAKYSKNGIAHPFEYEQRAFHYLLNTPVWQDRGLPTYPGNSTALMQHFTALPQCSMNSYFLHPLELRADRESSHYVPSDFIVHMAGKKGQIKTDLMNHFLSIAEKNYA
jgi:hypothetical protein